MHSRGSYSRSADSRLSGDFEDPRKRGILRNTSCHSYRQQLQSSQHANMLQGLMLLTGMATLVLVLWLQSMETTSDDQLSLQSCISSSLNALWLGVSGILGLDTVAKSAHIQYPDPDSPRAFHCNQKLDTMRIFRQISKQVINQEQALARLERAAKSNRPLRSVALLGPPGVGKTLTAMVLRQQFPWPENVHSYSWSTYVPDDAHKFNVIRNFVEELSSCGQNLLIIDNLSPCDYSFVPIYNKLLLEREGDSHKAANQSVLVIYIFNLEMQYYWQQYELLQQLPMETTIINYRPFGRAEVLDCLENELRLEQRTLDLQAISHIVEEVMLDVEDAGCKRIRPLLIQHGLSDPH
ncbi:uncharacterized protein LOC6583132 [Drosophila mojavensis]|uniref:Uncharacterized protein n=1 Tax=Drosophila mojavensis TaxID=7230 RepID=B4L1A4_DROMO|nr:uncharacterized protein LOC6583132 [Drosophila mojavensis]EDW19286.1 uncharacterized protein Dmoj_GI11610 [Drosophila mojavensis]